MTDRRKILARLPLLKRKHPGHYERCVLCGSVTDIPADLSIDRRSCYVEGSGQLCRNCWQKLYGK